MSGAYRALVAVTARSKFAMFAFTASVMVALPLLGTKLIMGATNPEQDTARENVLRKRQGMDSRARTNRQRADLMHMLRDASEGGEKMDARWKSALGVRK